MVLFGSYTRGNYTVFSDIDVLAVSAGHPRDDAFALTVKTLALRGLQAHVLSEEELHQIQPVWDTDAAGGRGGVACGTERDVSMAMVVSRPERRGGRGALVREDRR